MKSVNEPRQHNRIVAESYIDETFAGRNLGRWEVSQCVLCAMPFGPSVNDESWRDALGRCPACGHRQLSILPAPKDITTIFGSSYWGYGHSQPPGVTQQERAAIDLFVARERLDRDLVPGTSPPALFDLRAGSGALVRAARERGCLANGCEPIAALREFAMSAHQIELRASIPLATQANLATLSVIVAYGVIEQLINPTDLLANARQLLCRGGHLVIECHSADSMNFERLHDAWQWASPFCVAHLYTGSELVTIVERHQFKTIDLFSPGEDTTVIIAEATA